MESKGVTFKRSSILSNLPTLHLTSSGENGGDSISQKQHFQTICEWFEDWMPWQKRIVLCGTTDWISCEQLEYLATAMEPVFHRDFQAALKGQYPAFAMKQKKRRINSADALERAIEMAESDLESILRGRSGIGKIAAPKTMEEFAVMYIHTVVRRAIKTLRAEREKELADSFSTSAQHDTHLSDHYFQDSATNEDHQKEAENIQSDELIKAKSIPSSKGFPTENMSNTFSAKAARFNRLVDRNKLSIIPEPVVRNNTLSPLKEASPSSLLDYENETLTLTQSPNKSLASSPHRRSKTFPQDKESFSILSKNKNKKSYHQKLPVMGNVNSSVLDDKKLSSLSWCMSHQLVSSALSSSKPSSGRSQDIGSHRHHSRSSSFTAISTIDFFPREKVQRLGTYRGALRTGDIRRPSYLTDVPVSLQRACKPTSWWKGAPSEVRSRLVRANKRKLKEHFKEQVEKVWQWLQDLKDHERGDFLVELLKMCDKDLIKFFAQCLIKRLQEQTNILSLPDILLLEIFSFLPVSDLLITEKVCRRWKYITAHEQLWRQKVAELGAAENMFDLVEMVEDFMEDHAIDWKAAYFELADVIEKTKSARSEPAKAVQVKDKLKNYFEMRVKEFLDRIRPKFEVIVQSESSDSDIDDSDIPLSDDESKQTRRASGFVEPPVTFMATTQSHIDAITGMNEENQSTTPDQGSQSGAELDVKSVLRKRKMKRQLANQGADFALDVRPDSVQAKNILTNRFESDDEDETESFERDPFLNTVIKPIKRVRRLQGHSDAVLCLMFDGKRIITGSMDHSIRVWDIRSGRSIKKIYGHLGGIRCLQFTDTHIYSGSWDMSVRVWDIVRFTEIAVLTGHSGVVSCLQVRNTYLVTGSHDRTVRVWSVQDFRCEQILRHHTGAVTCLVFDGYLIVSGSTDKVVKVTDVSSGECVLTLTEASEPITAVNMKGNLVLACTMTGHLFCWKIDSGEVVAGVQLSQAPIYKIIFTTDKNLGARFLTACKDGSIQEWDLLTMTCLRALHGHKGAVRDLQATDDRIVSCSDDGNVRIWDLMPPSLRADDKANRDTIQTTTIDRRRSLESTN